MLFKMTLPIRKKTYDPDVSGLTALTRKQKGSGIFFHTSERKFKREEHRRRFRNCKFLSSYMSVLSANLLFY